MKKQYVIITVFALASLVNAMDPSKNETPRDSKKDRVISANVNVGKDSINNGTVDFRDGSAIIKNTTILLNEHEPNKISLKREYDVMRDGGGIGDCVTQSDFFINDPNDVFHLKKNMKDGRITKVDLPIKLMSLEQKAQFFKEFNKKKIADIADFLIAAKISLNSTYEEAPCVPCLHDLVILPLLSFALNSQQVKIEKWDIGFRVENDELAKQALNKFFMTSRACTIDQMLIELSLYLGSLYKQFPFSGKKPSVFLTSAFHLDQKMPVIEMLMVKDNPKELSLDFTDLSGFKDGFKDWLQLELPQVKYSEELAQYVYAKLLSPDQRNKFTNNLLELLHVNVWGYCALKNQGLLPECPKCDLSSFYAFEPTIKDFLFRSGFSPELYEEGLGEVLYEAMKKAQDEGKQGMSDKDLNPIISQYFQAKQQKKTPNNDAPTDKLKKSDLNKNE